MTVLIIFYIIKINSIPHFSKGILTDPIEQLMEVTSQKSRKKLKGD